MILTASDNRRRILLVAAWFGLAAGLVEGAGLFVLQFPGFLRGSLTFLGGAPQIIWFAPLFDLVLFGGLALALIVVGRLFPRLPLVPISVAIFATLAFFDWLTLLLTGRVSNIAVFILAAGLGIEASHWLLKYERPMVRFWRSSLPWLAGLAVVALISIQVGSWLREGIASRRLPKASTTVPNVLVVVVDTLRADHLSSYDYARLTSPNIDRLAEQGVLFENAFSTSSWTQPSHASLVTGRYTFEHDAELKPLDGRYPTIAEVMRALGYQTAAFSANNSVFNRRNGFGRGFIHFEDHYRTLGDIATSTVYGRGIEFRFLHKTLGMKDELGRVRASHITGNVLRWIDRHPGKPFFAFLNYYDPHAPYLPPEPYRSRFAQQPNPGGMINTVWDMDHIYVPMTPEQLQSEIDAYDGAIAYVDTYIGNLLEELQKRGLAENTMVVLTADHGELFGEHGLLEHTNSLYREVIHVPLIVWWPGHVPTGTRVVVPVSNASIPATILGLIGEDRQLSIPGPSLAPLWEMQENDRDWPYPLAELAKIPWVPVQHLSAHGAMKSAITPRWHYIEHESLGPELYDWLVDPHETNNLAEHSEVQAVRDQLRLILAKFLLPLQARH